MLCNGPAALGAEAPPTGKRCASIVGAASAAKSGGSRTFCGLTFQTEFK